MSETIFVTGAAGFIGFHMALSSMKDNITVIGIDNVNDYYDVSLKINDLKDSYLNSFLKNKRSL